MNADTTFPNQNGKNSHKFPTLPPVQEDLQP